MPRRPDPIPKADFRIRISQELFAQLELECYDVHAVGKTVSYGARNRIIETALRGYFAQRRNLNTDINNQHEQKEDFVMTTPQDISTLPAPNEMEPYMRKAEIETLRRRHQSGEDLSAAELERGLSLIRQERLDRTGKVPKGAKKAGSGNTKQVEAFNFADFTA